MKQRLFREMKSSKNIMNILKYIKEAIYSIQDAIKWTFRELIRTLERLKYYSTNLPERRTNYQRDEKIFFKRGSIQEV